MRLREAYERLELKAPVVHELQILSERASLFEETGGPRGLGTSVRMLVELCLDMDRAREGQQHAKFLVICLSGRQGRYLREKLREIVRGLSLNLDLNRVTFHPFERDSNFLAGPPWLSWAIFCDHAVKESQGFERPLGPYGLIRSVEQRALNSWNARDRDGNLVCRLTEEGTQGLVDASTSPVTFHYGDGTASVTFPTWRLPFALRLVEAFKS